MALSTLRAREIVIVIAAVCGFTLVIQYFVNIPALNAPATQLNTWAVLIAAFSWGIGFIRQMQMTALQARKRASGWPIKVYGAILCIVMSYFGVFYGTRSLGYDWLFNYVLTPTRTATVALTAPFIFSAGFRAFRARNIDATIFLLAGLLVMLQSAPVGEVIWSGFPVIGRWILDIPQNSVGRAILITTAVGIVAYSLRYLLGLERGIAQEGT